MKFKGGVYVKNIFNKSNFLANMRSKGFIKYSKILIKVLAKIYRKKSYTSNKKF